jgi:hypothetical protein
VEARYKGGKWATARVRRAHRDGTYDIEFDNGERDMDVPAGGVRAFPTTPKPEDRGAEAAAAGGQFREGQKVEARFRGRSKWFKGKVLRANRDGTYDVEYEDGDRETDVNAELIRALEGASRPTTPASSAHFHEGQKIEARYKAGTRWYKGRVSRSNRDGTFDIDYDDGEREIRVAPELIRSVRALACACMPACMHASLSFMPTCHPTQFLDRVCE